MVMGGVVFFCILVFLGKNPGKEEDEKKPEQKKDEDDYFSDGARYGRW
jgi:hypothetical protein